MTRTLSDLYDVSLKRGIRNAAKNGFIRPTVGESFVTDEDYIAIVSTLPPDPPTITGVARGNTQVTVSFTAPENNGGATITQYTATSTPGSITGAISQAGSGDIIVSGLTNGTSYTFKVYATNSKGNSLESSVSNAVIPATVPGIPNVGTVTLDLTTATVPFTAPTDNGDTITQYTATSTPGSITGILSQAGSGSISVVGLTVGTAYTFKVKATNSIGTGDESSSSNSIMPTYPTADRGVFGGGRPGFISFNIIDLITINTLCNAIDFGDLTVERYQLGSCSNGSNDRGIFGGGQSWSNVIDYVTISAASNATDFGDLDVLRAYLAATSNGTSNRGIFSGGYDSSYAATNVIEYITINSAGNSSDFGDLTVARAYLAATSNGTNGRGVFGGGYLDGYSKNEIDYITINSTGNATDLGDLTVSRNSPASCSNGTNNRATFAGGWAGANVIDYKTINTLGNAADFGDLTTDRRDFAACSNATGNRGVYSGGESPDLITIDYITITTLGNATNFGNLTVINGQHAGCSNS